MANQNAQQRFMQTLKASKNFQGLTPKEQEELKLIYEDVNEDQLALALEEIGMDEVELSALEDEDAQLAVEQTEMTQALDRAMQAIQKKEIKENTVNDKQESEKAAEAALHELD